MEKAALENTWLDQQLQTSYIRTRFICGTGEVPAWEAWSCLARSLHFPNRAKEEAPLFSASRSCSSIAWNTFALSSAWAFANISETLRHTVQYSTVLQCRNKRFVHPHIRKLTAKLQHYIVDKQKLLGKRIINTKSKTAVLNHHACSIDGKLMSCQQCAEFQILSLQTHCSVLLQRFIWSFSTRVTSSNRLEGNLGHANWFFF